ncbi:MAG: hypothetical protein JRH20_17215 [Deltaproteobacteria bacterium]|nr:hypothetical protein [Deltaproteobacteria bacterium]
MSDQHHQGDDKCRVRKIYVLSVVIIISIAAGFFWVMQGKNTKAHTGDGHKVGQEQPNKDRLKGDHRGHNHAAKPRARMTRPRRAARKMMGRGAPEAVDASPAGRVRFAQRMYRRIRRHDKQRMVLAMGKDRDILEMRFPMGTKSEQLQRFKKANQLFAELKGHGFREMRIRSGRAISFSKKL